MKKIVETIDPKTFTKYESYVCLSKTTYNGKYGLVDEGGNEICPCVCDSIRFAMPCWTAVINYKGLEFLLDRHSNYGTFLFFGEPWGIAYDLNLPYIFIVASWDLFLNHNQKKCSSYDMSESDIKAVYEEFVQLIKEHNKTITREEVLEMTNNDEVQNYLESLSLFQVEG